MTEEQINKKALEAYPVVSSNDGEWHDGHTDSNYKERKGYLKALNDIESLTKIKGWVARDKFVQWTSNGPVFDGIGSLIFFTQKPEKQGKYSWYAKGDKVHLDENEFHDLKYEDGPIEAEILIRKV